MGELEGEVRGGPARRPWRRPGRGLAAGGLAAGGRVASGLCLPLAGSALAAIFAAAAVLAACLVEPAPGLLPEADYRPPALLSAGAAGERLFLLGFDEEIRPVEGSFALARSAAAGAAGGSAEEVPGSGPPEAVAEGAGLSVLFSESTSPGADYLLSGEVADLRGNTTRFVLGFVGWNPRPPRLRLSEFQTAKNSSLSNSHRDYAELEVLADGNLGGVELAYASSVKAYRFRFPAAEVRAGDFVVLHLAPEGLPEELDETGSELGLSGGVDARPYARDFWSAAGGLPDESGAAALYERPGGGLMGGFFYANAEKAGPVGSGRLGELLSGLSAAGAWPLAGGEPLWEDAFLWKPSSARSLCRSPGSEEAGPGAWYLTAAGGQSPGAANPPPP